MSVNKKGKRKVALRYAADSSIYLKNTQYDDKKRTKYDIVNHFHLLFMSYI